MMKNAINRRQVLQTGFFGSLSLSLSGIPQFVQAENLFQSFSPAEIIQINGNENPYGPSKLAQKAVNETIMKSNRYAKEDDLIKLIAEREKISPENIVIGAGSTELLYLIASLYGRGKKVVLPEITFFGFIRFCKVMGAIVNSVPMTQKMEIDLPVMEKTLGQDTSLVFISNPNNPTGTILPSSDLKDFCEKASQKTMVFVDEAYIEFSHSAYHGSMIDLVRQNKNIIITRTFSKIYGLAGLRIGYLIAKPEIAKAIKEIRIGLPNVLGMAAAMASLRDLTFVEMVKQKNEEVKALFIKELDKMKIPYIPSPTNFIYANVGEEAKIFAQKMQKQNILISAREDNNWARFTMGTKEEMLKVLEAMRKVKI